MRGRQFAATLALVLGALPCLRSGPPSVGEPFPDVWLPRLDGSQGAISSFRGEKLLVLVYASW